MENPSEKRGSRILGILSKLQMQWWMLLVCLIYACVVGCVANRFPNLFWDSLLAFPILAAVFLILGLVYVAARVIITPDQVGVDWRALFAVAIHLAAHVFLKARVVPSRVGEASPKEQQEFLHGILLSFFKAIAMACLSLVCLLVAAKASSIPKETEPSLDDRASKIVELRLKQATHSSQLATSSPSRNE